MNDVVHSAEKRGVGFAYFRWHCLKWPDVHVCEYGRGGICHWKWSMGSPYR
jgi:hypothetical protein